MLAVHPIVPHTDPCTNPHHQAAGDQLLLLVLLRDQLLVELGEVLLLLVELRDQLLVEQHPYEEDNEELRVPSPV